MIVTKEIPLGGKTLTLQTGKLAKQADGSVTARFGDTVVLATAVYVPEKISTMGFLPLTVDYREYTYAAGRIPGGFFKREGRPTEKETLTSRQIDRPLRPLFPKGYACETQIISLVLSADGENDPDVLAVTAASTALFLSEIPFDNPIAAVRVGYIDGAFVLNPSNALRDKSSLALVVAGSADAIVMVEAGAKELPEATLIDAIFFAHEEIKKLVAVQWEMFRELGIKKASFTPVPTYTPELFASLRERASGKLREAMICKGKDERRERIRAVRSVFLEEIPSDQDDTRKQTKNALEDVEAEIFRRLLIDETLRLDNRATDEIREITTEVGLLPRTHGSALFTRGETQALVTCTLGTSEDAQVIEEYEGESEQKFILHYNFPPFSVGEVKFMRGAGRREIGHGNLARRALAAVAPEEDAFPYTIRIVSDILESNGSSSMASICGGSLALMDAGVPMRAPVAGVAMGLVKEGDKYVILSDIAGQEDHHGDMDFKVAGTRQGITALQMDIKISGINREIMERALAQAQRGRHHILDKMAETISEGRAEMSPFAPRLETIMVPKDKIRDIIGSGGKTIRGIVEETGCKIDVEDDGRVIIASSSRDALARARQIIEGLTAVAEMGKIYTGKVVRIEAYGAFVQILPGTDGLLHVSEITTYRVRNVTDVLNEGDEVKVKVIEMTGDRVRLSRKAVLIDEGITEEPPPGYAEAGAGSHGSGHGESSGEGRRDSRGGDRGRERDRGGRGRRPSRPGA